MVVCCKNNAHFSKEAKGVKSVAVRIWHKRMRLHMTHAELWQYLSCSKTIVLLYWDSCVTWYINLMSHMECTRSYISIYTQLPINIFPLKWLKKQGKNLCCIFYFAKALYSLTHICESANFCIVKMTKLCWWRVFATLIMLNSRQMVET